MRRLRAVLPFLAALSLAGQPAAAEPGGAALDMASRALAEGEAALRTADPEWTAGTAVPLASWGIAPAGDGIAAVFLVSSLQVAKSRLPLPSGLGLALTAYDVLDGRTSPAKAVAGMLENEAIDTVFVGVQAATLWLAAKALAGGSTVAVSGMAASATTGAAAAVPVVAPVAGVKLGGIAAAAPLNDFVTFGAAGVAGVAAALATTALTWGYRRYEAAAIAASRWEGLVRGAERSLDPGLAPALQEDAPLPAR